MKRWIAILALLTACAADKGSATCDQAREQARAEVSACRAICGADDCCAARLCKVVQIKTWLELGKVCADPWRPAWPDPRKSVAEVCPPPPMSHARALVASATRPLAGSCAPST